ncbi:DEAD/DEAH box helicase [Streptomyces sp. TRM68367]|uniref:DEAD/DEAH box helicase n=1 Tax=Streptomyces sp. TRM68367 TaxID=2758415 RepID=UPI0021CE61E0|nr:DEAD/DEAH box helicase [Streptomyces sp. TRM68367]
MAPTGLETEAVELVLPHGRSVRRRRVEGYALPVAVAVSALANAEPTHPSGAAWQAATRFALRLLADGRLHPALTPAGYDTWQVGPCTAAQRQTLDALAAAFPPHAHCLPEPGPAPVRIAEPAALVRQFCDAVADDLVRTPAAPLAMGALPYAWREARAVPTLREWAEETRAALTAEVSVSLRVDVPEGRRRQFRAVLQLHTAADPALVIEAARLWSEPTEVERLLGPRAATETLLALRRGAHAWPPLRRLLNDAAPDQLRLTDDEAFDLLGDATDALRAAGVDVHWPRDLVKALTATAEIGQRTAPGSTAGGLLDTEALLDFRWQVSLGGEPLTEAEGDRHLKDLAGDEIVLVTYGVLRRDREVLAETAWSLVAADEAQHVKNPYAVTARELRALPARARVALTGTPVENNLSELWALLDWTTPGLLGSLTAFRDRHARAIEAGEDPEAAERLSRLVRPFLLRRKKSDPGIAPELPPKTETDHVVPLTAEQTSLYEAQVRETMAKIAESEGIARRGLVLKLLTALKQICNHPAQYLKEHSLRQSTPLRGRSGKLDLLDELLDTITAEGESVLVFTQYKQMAALLEKHLAERGVPALFLHGATPVARREEMVDRFERGEVPVFLLSLKAAGTGLNLTRATHVVHYDRWWNPAVEDQATDRAYRIGQDKPVQVHKLLAEGTVEDKVAKLLEAKRALADAVVGSGEAALTELSDADLAELVALGRQS